MKEMIYKPDREVIILYRDYYKDIEFCILSLGTHPTAYVNIPDKHPYYKKEYEQVKIQDVNGGLTFSDETLKINVHNNLVGWWLGWDYAHYGDYTGYEELMPRNLKIGGKKWTTEEIYEEVKHYIDLISEVK